MTVTRDVAATRQRVWDVLADGWTYSGWVVGNSRIRAVSSNWPAPGSRILHSIGAWPAVINDETVVESSVSGEELVLLAKVRPAAEARITMRANDIPGGCRVEMTEVAVSRPLRWVPDSVQLTGVAPRNRECTWQLAMIAEKQDRCRRVAAVLLAETLMRSSPGRDTMGWSPPLCSLTPAGMCWCWKPSPTPEGRCAVRN